MDNVNEFTHLIKLWLDERNCGFWRIEVLPHFLFDVIELDHTYKADGYHDNDTINIRIMVPHEIGAHEVGTYKYVSLSDSYRLGGQIKIPPSDPNFFLCLRSHINNAIMTVMEDLYRKLERGIKFRGVYAKSPDNS